MYKVIFADDEKLVRNRIGQIIQWEEAGFQLVGCCANGYEVMEVIDKVVPDLVVLDINMPFITGIDAAKQIKNSYPHVKIVFITGYTEFEYAKSAIDLGALKYMVKPVTADDFRDLLAEVKALLDRENAHMQKVSQLEHLYQEAQKMVLQDILSDPNINQSIYGRVRNQNLPWTEETHFQVAVIKVDEIHEGQLWTAGDGKSMVYAVANIAAELAVKNGYALVKDESVVLLGAGEKDMDLQVEMQDYMSTILHVAEHMLNFTVSAGLGQVCQGCASIYGSYVEAIQALELRSKHGGNKLYTKEDLEKSYTRHTAVWDAIRYIEDNYATPDLSVDDISSQLHISPSYLRSLFKRQMGNTIVAHITKVRMEKALELLKEGSLKNSNIAEVVGYTDSHYFSYCFKRFYGISTAEMRAKVKKA